MSCPGPLCFSGYLWLPGLVCAVRLAVRGCGGGVRGNVESCPFVEP